MIKRFIGSKRQIKFKKNLELAIKVISSPLWIPVWLIAIIGYYFITFIEYTIEPVVDNALDKMSTWITRRFIK